jgi:hypothetical protein
MKVTEFFTNNKHSNLFSRIEVRYKGVNVVIYWIRSDSEVELIKMKKRRW